jgi:hypothetical protein
MPTFKITDPQSGRTVSVTGDTPPSESDINQIFQSVNGGQQPAQQTANHPVMDFLRKIGLGAVPDALGTAQFAGKEAGMGINPLNSQGVTPQQLQQAAQGNAFLTPQQLQQTGGVKQAGQDLAGAASYMVPFGKGASLAAKVIAPGAAAGALQATSQGQNPVIGGAEGVAGAGALHGLGQLVAPVLGKAGASADNLGNKLIQSQYLASPSSKIANDIKGTVASLSKYGVTNPETMQQIASQVTGGDGIVNQIKKQAIANAKPVDLGGITALAKQAIANEPLINGTPYAKNFQQVLKSGIYSAAQGTPAGGDPLSTFHFIQDLEGKAADLRAGNATKTEQALGGIYSNVAHELKDRLFNDSAADTQIPPLSPAQYQQLSQIHPQLAQDVAGAQNIKQLRSIEAPFVRGSKLAGESEDRQNIKPVDWQDVGIGLIGGLHPATLAALGAKKYANSNMGKRQIGGALMGVGNTMRGATPVGSGMQALLDMIGAKGASTNGQ